MLGNIIVLVNANTDSTNLAGATNFQITTPVAALAGQPFNVTVTAVDANGNPATGFTGMIAIGSGSQPNMQPFSYTFTAADAGTHTFTNVLALNTAGTQTVTVTSPFLPAASQTVAITATTATHFAISAPANAPAGTPISLTLTALDAYGNAAAYTGTVIFNSSDVQAGLPAAYTFTAADAGVHTFTATLKTGGAQTVTARDATVASLAGTSGIINVTPAVATALSINGGGGFIGSSHTVTVTARDTFGNVASTYSGAVHLSSSDAATSVSADVTLVNGVGAFTVTPMTLGAQTLSAIDTANGAIVGAETVTVTPGWATRFTATPLSATTAGNSQTMTVTAFDAFGNVSNVYTGLVLVSTTDARVGSFYYTFTAADAGVHTFNIALTTAGSQSVSVTDYYNSSVIVKQAGIAVTPAAAASLSFTPLSVGSIAGTIQTVAVTLRDLYGNVATGYRGTLGFSSTDVQAALPTAYTFTAADAGVHSFTVVFKTASKQTFTVKDTANVSLSGSQSLIDVVAGSAMQIVISAPSNAVSGSPFSVRVSATDAYGNEASTYVGTMHFTTSAKGSSVPIDYTFTAADKGAHVFLFTLNSTGTQTLTATDAFDALSSISSVNMSATTAPPAGGGGGGGKTTPPVTPPTTPPVTPPATPPTTPPATPPATPPKAPGGSGGGKKPVV